ncbi:MAG: dihydroorotase family protein, partial [Acidimicrobiia bacterium]
MTITVKGGTVVSATALGRADLRIEGETIAEIGDLEPDGEVVDATGLLVLPGMVDTHVHLMDPGPTDREDFPTGTSAAAARGVTTVVEHTHAHPIRSVSEFDDKRHYLQERSNVDYGLAAHVWPDHIGDITELAAAGISFFKIFTCTTHGVPGLDPFQLREALIAIAGAGIGCLIHNEDESLTTSTERRLREEGRSDPG